MTGQVYNNFPHCSQIIPDNATISPQSPPSNTTQWANTEWSSVQERETAPALTVMSPAQIPEGFNSTITAARLVAGNLHENELLDILNYFKWAAHWELTLGRLFVAKAAWCWAGGGWCGRPGGGEETCMATSHRSTS